MTAPVVGPVYKYLASTNQFYDRWTYTQAKPVDRPLLYRAQGSKLMASYGALPVDAAGSYGGMPNGYSSYSLLNNISYERLRGEVSDSALWAVNLAEYNQSIAMMVNRTRQLARFTRHLMRLNFVAAAAALGLDGKPARVSVRRSMANNWLEYSFGWKPLIMDIYSTIDLLQEPIKSITPKGSASASDIYDDNPSAGGLIWTRKRRFGMLRAKQGCEISISNPNLYLANNLGLANPAIVAWELVPFSFVIDWFANVGNFLSSGTDFLGLTVKNPWAVVSCKTRIQTQRYNYWSNPSLVQNAFWQAYYIERKTQLSGVTLKFYPARYWGWQRMANASSVLIQVLGKVR